MNSYTISNVSQTIGYVSIGIIATALLINVQTQPVAKEAFLNIKGLTYQSSGTSPTLDQYSNIYSGEFMPNLDPFIGAMSNLYANLLNNQEQLEPEFEAVLNENIWDLYES